MKITTVDLFHAELDISLGIQLGVIEDRAEQAMRRLDDLVNLMQLRADYHDFRFSILQVMPLGIQTDFDRRLVRWWAKRDGFGHIVDALIDELSLKGVGIELALRN